MMVVYALYGVAALVAVAPIAVALGASQRKSIEEQLKSLPQKYRFKVPDMVYEPIRTPTCQTGLRGRMGGFLINKKSSYIDRTILLNPFPSNI